MSNMDNIITFAAATQIGTENIAAGSYAILLTDDKLNTTLVEVVQSGSDYIKASGGSAYQVSFSNLNTAKSNSSFTEENESWMPQNVITVSGTSNYTFNHDQDAITPDGSLVYGKSYAILPQNNGSWSFKEVSYNSTDSSWQLVNGGVSLQDVHTGYVFGSSPVTNDSNIAFATQANGTFNSHSGSGGGNHVHYEVRSLYEGTTSAITGVKAKVIKVEYDIWGTKTETDVTSTLGAEGLTLTLEKNGSAIPDGNSDGTWEYSGDSVSSYDGEDLDFVLTRDSDSQEVGGNGIRITTSHDQYRIEHQGTGLQDNVSTPTINESKSIQFSIYDVFTGADASLSAGGLVLNVYSASSDTNINVAGNLILDSKTDLDTTVVYRDAANVSDFLSFQLIDKGDSDNIVGGSGPYNVSEIHQFSSSQQGAQQAPITAASFANSGTSGMMSTDPIIVGSNGDNAFDLSSGAYSESPSGSSPDAPKFNVAFGTGDEDSIVVTTTDTALKAKAATDVSIKGVKADGTKVDITAAFVKTGTDTVTFTAASIGETGTFVSIEASIAGETQKHSVSFLEDYAAFGGDGNDTATGVQAGDSFIGGDGKDTTFLTGAFKDYSFYQATDAQIENVVDNSLSEIISEKMVGTVSNADKASMKEVMMGTPEDGDPIFTLTANQLGTHAGGKYAIKGNVDTGYELQLVTENTTYGGVSLIGTSWESSTPTTSDNITASDAALLTAASQSGAENAAFTTAILDGVQAYIIAQTTGDGSYSASGQAINIAAADSHVVTTFLDNATDASVVAHIPSAPLSKVIDIAAPDADQSQIWAITNNGSSADSATTFVQSENIKFEDNPNMELSIGPDAQTVYKVGSTAITQGTGSDTITLEANASYALSTTGSGGGAVHTVQKVVADTGPGAQSGDYVAAASGPVIVNATTAGALDDGNVLGTYQPEYFLSEKVVASDSFAEQTVELKLDSALGSNQNLFWQINVDPNDPNSAQLEDFMETHGVVEVSSTATTVPITIKVRNDGDQDEGNENFKVDLGYVVGPNKIENVEFSLIKHDGTSANVDKDIDITPTLGATETLITEAPKVLIADAVQVGPAATDLGAYTTTLNDGDSDGTIDSITVDLTLIGKGTIDIIGTDTIGNKLNMTDLGTDGSITGTDLEYAASGSNAYLSQASTTATIKGDPLEYYVFSGASYHFLGKDFLGNVVKKNVQKTDTDVKSFSSIQEALTDAETNANVSEIRVAVNHNEAGSNLINIGKEDLKIDFWDEWDGSAAHNHNAGSVLNFKLEDGVVAVEFGGIRDLNVTGNDEDNYIIGNDGNNKIYGGAGDDVILAGKGDDIIKGGSGDDVLDGSAGNDKVYGQRGDDIVVATGAEDVSTTDLISGGSGDDTLVDAANKTTGEVVIVAGSGDDTISFGAARTNIDFQVGAPVSEETYFEREINAHLIDLSKDDKLDIKGIKSVADSAIPTALVTDATGLTTAALDKTTDIAPRSTFDTSSNELEIDLGTVGSKGLVAVGVKLDDVDTNGNGTTDELTDEIAAPILAVSGEIEISLGSTSLVNTALTSNSGNPGGVIQGLMDNGGDGLGGVEPFRDLYGVNDDLIWVDTTA